MEITTTITDRAALVQLLENEIKQPVEYAGAPTFNYSVGPYTVLRNASIRVDDDKASPALIQKMQELGYVAKDDSSTGMEFEIGEDSLTRVNLVNTFAARGSLINKAIGKPNAFYVAAALVRVLKDNPPEDLFEFNEAFIACGGDKALKGITFLKEKVVFTGFPDGRSEEEKEAFRDFAETITAACRHSKWLKGDAPEVENEKYIFRSWMNSMGLSGKKHTATRRILLERLSGDSSFRTPEQRAVALAKQKKKEEKEHDNKPDFIVLG